MFLMVFLSFLIFFYEKLRLFAVRLENNDWIQIIKAWEISKKHVKAGTKSGS